MFTLIRSKLEVSGNELERYSIYLSFEAHLAIDRMQRDKRYSVVEIVGKFDSLQAAQSKQNQLAGL
jgi:hypothetical protein